MQLFVTITHVLLALMMIMIILLQPGKEGGAALAGGSSGNQMYGPRGAGNFLGRATTFVATGFMVTSIALALYSSERVQSGTNIEDAIGRLEGAENEDDDGFGIPMPITPNEPALPIEPVDAEPDTLDAEDAGPEAVGIPAGETTTDSPSPPPE